MGKDERPHGDNSSCAIIASGDGDRGTGTGMGAARRVPDTGRRQKQLDPRALALRRDDPGASPDWRAKP